MMWTKRKENNRDDSSTGSNSNNSDNARYQQKKKNWFERRFRRGKKGRYAEEEKSKYVQDEELDEEEIVFEKQYLQIIHQTSSISTLLRKHEYDDETSDEIAGTVADVVVTFNQVKDVFTEPWKR
jgi:hypothetical protein